MRESGIQKMSNNIENEMCERILSTAIANLKRQGKLSEKNLEDPIIFKKIISENSEDIINNSSFILTNCEELRDSLIVAINKNYYDVAIILAATLLEHYINIFYHTILFTLFNFSKTKFEQAMKSLTFKDKFGWFFEIVTNESIESNLLSKLTYINSTRNSTVHFKPKIENFNEYFNNPNEKSPSISISELLTIVDNLQIVLEQNEDRLIPEINWSKKAFQKHKPQDFNSHTDK